MLLLYSPLAHEHPTDGQIVDLLMHDPDTIVVDRGGTVSHALPTSKLSETIGRLDRRKTRPFAKHLDEDGAGPMARVSQVMREFCPDPLLEVLLALDASIKPQMVLANYVFMTRGFPLLREDALKVIDTVDVFSSKRTNVTEMGIDDHLVMSEETERTLLQRGDLVIAIQLAEAERLRAMDLPGRVVTAGVDYDIAPVGKAPTGPIVLVVGSANHLNVRGLRDFQRFAWPLIRRAVPGAELRVVGALGEHLTGSGTEVSAIGQVDDLTDHYAEARVVINPAAAGTGLKVKTIEALANLRPIVVWPVGTDGLRAELAELCHVATDWFAFAQEVIKLLGDETAIPRLQKRSAAIADHLSAGTVYMELDGALPVRAASA